MTAARGTSFVNCAGDQKATAKRLACDLHRGQTDKAGRRYIDHVERVVAILVERWPDASADEITAAWLHDVLEDTAATAGDLIEVGISLRAVEIVKAVTRQKGMTYRQWINGIAFSWDVGAIRVKLADLADNSAAWRVAEVVGAADLVRTRYATAKEVLEGALVHSLRRNAILEWCAKQDKSA